VSVAEPLGVDAQIGAHAAGDNSCFHCGLPLPSKLRFEQAIRGITRRFCCPACRMVCNTIYNAGLEGFYQRTDAQLAPPPPLQKDLAIYDLDDVQAEFVTALGAERDISLLVEGIHCAACVWLIERTLAQMPGVRAARVNLSGRRLWLRWDNTHLKLSQVLARLGEIGYAAVPYDPEIADNRLKQHNRALLLRMAFAAFAMMNLLWISIALYSGANQDEFRNLFHWVGFALATPTLFYSGYPFLRNAWTGLRRLHLTMDLPIATGALTTYGYSVYVTLSQSAVGEVYYDTVVNFLFVILVGRYLEAMSKRHAVASTQRLLDLQPRAATVLRDGEFILLPIRAVKSGDTVLIKPGEKVPVDGNVLEGRSHVDEAMLSGESQPVAKGVGDKVAAGTINLDNALRVRVDATLRNTALGRIIHLVEEAQSSKAPIQCTADRIVPWFVAATLTLAAVTFFLWMGTDFELALMAATAVLIITCPCAAGLATPMAIASASGLGARFGILIKNGGVLESLSHMNHFVFDKTGTLTEGRMSVRDVVTLDGIDADVLMAQVAALERYSEHNIASAVLAWTTAHNIVPLQAWRVENKPGCGMLGNVGDRHIVLGTANWLKQHHVAPNAQLQKHAFLWELQGISCVHVAVDGHETGVIAVGDQLRPGARELIEALRADGIRVTLLSGDRRPVVEAIAKQLGDVKTIAEVLPEDKDRIIRQLQQDGAKVAMVGDGINDAPALNRAGVGIALGSGTDVSGESADIVLMSNELDNVRLVLQLSRRTLRTIHQNFGISFAYNIIMVPLAMAAMITPLIAAIAMPISSLLVIGNAARIRTLFKRKGSR
jgi:Cu2+-exporting ATPase